MDTKIKKFLDSNRIKYEVIKHRKVYTAFNSAETQHASVKHVVKTVFVKFPRPVMLLADGDKVDGALVCVPAGKRVDLKKIAKSINDLQATNYKLLAKKDLKTKKPAKITAKLANEKDIIKRLKTKVGLISPFGQVFGLPVLLDKKLIANKKLIVSAGSYTESLEISAKDYIKIAKPIMGNYTE